MEKFICCEDEFPTISETDLIKQEYCTFGLDEKKNFCFICACSSIDFTQICSYCFIKCHNNGQKDQITGIEHRLVTKIKGVFDCECGRKKHNCSNEKKEKKEPVCYYSTDIVDHPGFFVNKSQGHVICAFCLECVENKNQYEKIEKPEKGQKCHCTKHEESNQLGLIFDFIKAVKSYSYKKMKNFNPNIINKMFDQSVYKKDTLTNLIKDYKDDFEREQTIEKKMELNKKLFKECKLFNILKTISVTLDLTRNPNFSLSKKDLIVSNSKLTQSKYKKQNDPKKENDDDQIPENNEYVPLKTEMIDMIYSKNEIKEKTLIEIFEFPSSKSFQHEFDLNQFQSHFEAKFYFAELIYNMYFRSYLLEHNNCVANIHAIESMDVLQRYVYFNEARSFKNYKINQPLENTKAKEQPSKDTEKDAFMDNVSIFVKAILKVLEDMVSNFKENISLEDITVPFNLCNKIMKEFIKYNLIKDMDLVSYRYFMLVQDALKLDRKILSNFKSIGENFIIKSIYYTLLYKNDEEIVQKLRGKSTGEGYCFVQNKENDLISNVFLMIINSKKKYLENKELKSPVEYFENNENLKKVISDKRKNKNILKFDVYVYRIMDLMAGNSNFYLKSLKKLKLVDEKMLACFTDSEDYSQTQSKIIKSLRSNEHIFSTIMNFSTDLTNYNKKYFHYRISFIQYISGVAKFTHEFKNFINIKIHAIPLQSKYSSTKEKDFGDKNSINNLKLIKNASKFSNIFQALNGFFYIYAEDKSFKGKAFIHSIGEDIYQLDNRSYSSKDILLTLLSYLFSVFWNDHQSFSLISTFNPRNFVLSFMECEAYFYYFLENIMDACFGKLVEGNSMNNYSFYASLVTEMIYLIDFSYFQKISPEELKDSDQLEYYRKLTKLIELISTCCKLCVKPLRNLNLYRTRLIDLIQVMLYKIEELKSIKIFNKEINEFLNGSVNYDKFTSDKRHVWENKDRAIEGMLKNYFQLMNGIMNTDLNFFGIVNPKAHYILSLNQIHHYLTKWKDDCIKEEYSNLKSILLELTMRTFLHKNLFSYDLTPQKILDIFPKSRDMESFPDEVEPSVPVYLKNYFLRDEHFGVDDKHEGNHNDTELKDLNSKADYLIGLMKLDQNNFFQKVLISSKQIKSLIKRRILLLAYFENTYVRSIYNLINQFMFKGEKMTGEQSFKIYELVFNFLKCIYIFYIEIVSIDVLEDDVAKELNIFESKEFDLYSLENLYMEFPKQESEKVKFMDDYIKTDLTDDIKKLTDKVMYFEIEEVLKIFKEHLKRILICDDMTQAKVRDRENKDKGKRYKDVINYLLEKALNPKKLKKDEDVCKRITGDYINKSNKCKELKRSLIKAISISQNEQFDNLGIGLYEYLVKQSLHLLTHANCSIKFKTQKSDINLNISYKNFYNTMENYRMFNLQNVYVFNIFNNLFYHDAATCQKIFYSILKENKEYNEDAKEYNEAKEATCFPMLRYIKFIFTNSIFCSIVYECSKVYRIDRISNSNMICFQIIQESVKFLQNLCEGHNNFFQTLLYRLDVIIKDVKTPMLNLIMEAMSLLIFHSHFKKESVFYNNRTFKDFYTLTVLYERLADVLIEMSQGTIKRNYKRFFDKVNVWKEVPNKQISQADMKSKKQTVPRTQTQRKHFPSFDAGNQGIEVKHKVIGKDRNYSVTLDMLFKLMKELFNEDANLFQTQTISIKIKFFQIMNNIIIDCDPKETNEDGKEPHVIMTEIFPPEYLIEIVTFYFKALYITNLKKANIPESSLQSEVAEMQLDEEHLEQIKHIFTDGIKKIGFQPYFKIGITLFMFITLMADKFENEEAVKIRNHGQKISIFNSDGKLPEEKEKTKIENDEDNKTDEKRERIVDEYKCKMISAKFFGNLIRKCEFVIRQEKESIYEFKDLKELLEKDGNDILQTQKNEKEIQEEEKEKYESETNQDRVKNVYFIIDHRNYNLSQDLIDKFLNKVERSTPTTKLKELLEQLELVYAEIHYNQKQTTTKRNLKTDNPSIITDYQLSKFNFLISIFINLIIIFTFRDDSFFSTYHYYFILLLSLVLIGCNAWFMKRFLRTKYKFLTKMEKSKIGLKSRDRVKWNSKAFFKIYFLNTIVTEDNSMILLNILIPLICLVNSRAVILFPLQLLTVVKFIDTIDDIVKAFTYKLNELLTMVAFLGILILFYANLGFFFMPKEFEMDLDDGTHFNACDSLLNCLATYFNFGIRSGGGIGDVTAAQTYSEPYWYALRFIFDMIFYITVILLIMNMINGIIISTFGALREENEKKEEDIEGKCFICSLSKAHFEKYKVNFEEHKLIDHRLGNYLKYFINLKMSDERELNSEESFIKGCINNKDIGIFPVLKAKSLQEIPDYQLGDEEAEE